MKEDKSKELSDFDKALRIIIETLNLNKIQHSIGIAAMEMIMLLQANRESVTEDDFNAHVDALKVAYKQLNKDNP